MSKQRLIEDSKNYLISVHDTLRRAFRNSPPEEHIIINEILESIEKNVKQIEMLEEMMKVWNITKKKKLEMINEE